MILEEYFQKQPRDTTKIANCDHCGGDKRAVIRLEGYGDGQNGNCDWCWGCAQNALKELKRDLRKLDRGK
jgi:hypothetical protein